MNGVVDRSQPNRFNLHALSKYKFEFSCVSTPTIELDSHFIGLNFRQIITMTTLEVFNIDS